MIRWNYEESTRRGDLALSETRVKHPEGLIRLSELARAKAAARRYIAKRDNVAPSRVTVSPVYNEGMESIAYVVAYTIPENN